VSQIIDILLDLIIYILAGMTASWYYYSRKRKALLGGFWGGAVIGMIGAVIIHMLTGIEGWFIEMVTWLMKPKFGSDLIFRVNLISAAIGSALFVYILNQINHDRNRRD